eukprot:TRINITY_DN13154_c0_g1_i1.p1 TRINITY_DN13154_c0_g1~~TRINITY_DN13154_c0_g1_i1.p1  ORF type:complete len:793 (+),score=227.96 TRINITY_DN13154_c0_g1_i1:114-2381(+)
MLWGQGQGGRPPSQAHTLPVSAASPGTLPRIPPPATAPVQITKARPRPALEKAAALAHSVAWGDVRATTAGVGMLPTGLEDFDVDCWVIFSCIERIEAKASGARNNAMDKQRKQQLRTHILRGPVGLGTAATDGPRQLRTSDSADPVLSELSIMRRSVERMQAEVRGLLRRTEPQAGLLLSLQKEAEQLREALRTAQAGSGRPGRGASTLHAGRPSMQPRQQPSPVAVSPSGLTPAPSPAAVPAQPATGPPAQRPDPARQAARHFRELYPDCFWSQVVLMLQYGRGNYDLLANMQDPEPGSLAFPARTRVRKEAAMYGLERMAETLCQFRSAAVLVRRLLLLDESDPRWSPALLRPPLLVGGGTGSHSDPSGSPACPLRCKGIMSYLGTKTTRRSEPQWSEAPFENPCRCSVEVTVGCSSVWGKCDPGNIVDERMEFFSTQDRPGQWVAVDFNDAVVIPHAYSFVSFHPIMAGYYPRNWEFQGSVDGKEWETIKRHTNDQTLTRDSAIGTWVVHKDHLHREPQLFDDTPGQEPTSPTSAGVTRDIVQDRLKRIEAEAPDASTLRLRLAIAELRFAKLAKESQNEPTPELGAMVQSPIGGSITPTAAGKPRNSSFQPPESLSSSAPFTSGVFSGRKKEQFVVPQPRRLRLPCQGPESAHPDAPPDPFEAGSRKYYRLFRIMQTGPNSFGSHQLQLTSLEIYGEIVGVSRFTAKAPPQPLPPRDSESLAHWHSEWDHMKAGEYKQGGGKKDKGKKGK